MGKIAICRKHAFVSPSFTSSLMFNNYNFPIVFSPVFSHYRNSELPAFKMNFVNEAYFFLSDGGYIAFEEKEQLYATDLTFVCFLSETEKGSYTGTADSVFCCYPQVKVSNEWNCTPFCFQNDIATEVHSPSYCQKIPLKGVCDFISNSYTRYTGRQLSSVAQELV